MTESLFCYVHLFSTSKDTPVQDVPMTPEYEVISHSENSRHFYETVKPVEGASNAAFCDEKSAVPEQ
jgi:hypothetical protein